MKGSFIIGKVRFALDSTQRNPNGEEFDNFYIDVNEIVHLCCESGDRRYPKDDEQVILSVFDYMDRLFNIIQPRKLLFIALDGVAPTAKYNKERAKMFCAAKESVLKLDRAKTKKLSPENVEQFDRNCLTPGTPFMETLSECLCFYIKKRLTDKKAWQKLLVFFSDCGVPGEAKTKILQFIKKQSEVPEYNENVKHCLYGASDTSIILGLATHENHFSIIREDRESYNSKSCELDGSKGMVLWIN